MNTNPIIGKTIVAMEISEDRQALRFVLSDGECIVDTDADCCSYTWIEHVELPALGFPALVVSVDELDMPERSTPSDFHPVTDSLAFYGCKIVTDKGEIVIDYRNDSNGYYGGSLSWPGEHHYGGVYGQNNSKHQWRSLTK